MDWTRIGPPEDVRPLLPEVRAALVSLLQDLSLADWARPTVCPGWTVHHLAGHIVHDFARKVSMSRDSFTGDGPAGGEDVPAFLARANGAFADVAATLSPAVVIDLIEHFGPQFEALWDGADLAAAGAMDVGWLAPGVAAPVWADLAREYSEQWIHQQQLRDAVRRPGGRRHALLRAALGTLARSLPRTLAGVRAEPGAQVTVTVTGDLDASWRVVRDDDGWRLDPPVADRPGSMLAQVTLPADALWRVASRGIEPEAAVALAELSGDQAAGRTALTLLSIIR
jgi:uncharacterized protein (TIGR03083 family)